MTEDFQTLLAEIRRVFPQSSFEPVPEAQLARLHELHPEAPAHYLDFLRHVGFGALGEMRFMVYDGLVEPNEIFDPFTAQALAGVLFIGDDFAGWQLGFDTRSDWRLVGIDSAGPRCVSLQTHTLADFVRHLIATEEVG